MNLGKVRTGTFGIKFFGGKVRILRLLCCHKSCVSRRSFLGFNVWRMTAFRVPGCRLSKKLSCLAYIFVKFSDANFHLSNVSASGVSLESEVEINRLFIIDLQFCQ